MLDHATTATHTIPLRLFTEIRASDLEHETWVALDSLQAADTPRLEGLDPAHAAALAEIEDDLPPLLVQRSTMRVIDGMHRLDAARIRGAEKVRVHLLDCSEDYAFLLAVAANIRHGLPLTLRDRRAAAVRIIQLRPEASDRWIGELAGLAAKTVAAVRRNAPGMAVEHRVGRDGRVRPLNAAEGRRIAGQMLAENPETSLSQIARGAGISVGTARDVREKVRQGIDPVLSKREISPDKISRTPADINRQHGSVDYDQLLERLRRDPSLRYTESGRSLLRWLCPPRLISSEDWQGILESIPPHCAFDIMRAAYSCASAWAEFGAELDRTSS